MTIVVATFDETLPLESLPSLVALSPQVEVDRVRIEALVHRLRANDRVLVERILRELLPLVRTWSFRLLGPHADLDDAVQDALSEVASALHRFEGRASLSTLAHCIATRTAYRFYRRRGRLKAEAFELDEEQEGNATTPEEQALAREAVRRLYAHLEALSEVRRTAFALCAIEGLTPTEAGQIVGCSSVAMRSRLFHARNELAMRLETDELLAPYAAQLREGAES